MADLPNQTPLVSLILPLHNCEKYIHKSINSLLSQTYKNIEILVMDDGSTDRSLEVARSIKDPRLKIFTQKNEGLAKTLNTLIAKASGDLIARQDQDDISIPERIEKQVRYLIKNKKHALVGTCAKIIVDETPSARLLIHPTKCADLRLFLYFDNPFVHTSVMFRKKTFNALGGYRAEKELQPEDYELWRRFASVSKVGNLPEFLVVYRELSSSMSRLSKDPFPFLPHLAADYIHTRTFGLVPKSIATFYAQLYHRKHISPNLRQFEKWAIVIYVSLILGLRELRFSKALLGRVWKIVRFLREG